MTAPIRHLLPIHPVRLLALFAILACLGPAAAFAQLRLVAKSGDHPVVVTGIEGNRIVGLDGEKKVIFPAGAAYELTGDFREVAALASWSPAYAIKGGEKPTATVSVRHNAEWAGQKSSSAFLERWPEGVPESALALMVWLVGGRVSQLHVEVVPSTRQVKFFVLRHEFQLSSAETAGQGVVLLWMNGRLVAPRPRFSDPTTQAAMTAMLLGDLPAFRARLDAGLKPTVQGNGKATLLHFAAEAGNLEAVSLLLERGAKPGAAMEDGTTPLHWAAGKGRAAVVERLFAAKASVRAEARDGYTALHAALRAGHPSIARRLVEQGADVNAENDSHEFPFGMAINEGDAELAELMLAHGARKDFRAEQMQRVLITQAAKGHNAMVRFLIKHKVSVQSSRGGRTILAAAAAAGNRELAEVLLKAGARADDADATGQTPLMIAAAAGNLEFARALLDAGADINRRSKAGRTCLHYAALRDRPELALLLLDRGADLQAEDQTHITPVGFALVAGARGLVDIMAARGSRINLKLPDADENLEAALKLNVPALISAALADGWSPDARLRGNWPAILIARVCGATGCVAVLEHAGAKAGGTDWPELVPNRDIDTKPQLAAVVLPEDPRDIDAQFPSMVVTVTLVLDEQGRPRFPVISHTPDLRLGLATLQAVTAWRFTPALRNGKPACVLLQLPVEFPASSDRVVDITQADVQPQALVLTPPAYPSEMLSSSQIGKVVLRFTVDKEGRVKDARVTASSHPGFERAALAAVGKWTFKPALLDGKPVAVRADQEMIFSIP